jgi:hypothetical protein
LIFRFKGLETWSNTAARRALAFSLPGQGVPKIPSSRSCLTLVVSIVLAGLLALSAAGANAATRFAAPGGASPASSACPADKPCSLFAAASAEAAETALRAGDEVIVAPGKYTKAAGDLGLQGTVRLAQGITVHGVAGLARPVISSAVTAGSNAFAELVVDQGDLVSHLEIQSGLLNGILVRDGVVEEVVVRNQTDFGSACTQEDGQIRNTACLSTGASGRALAATALGSMRTPVMRNVTAVATGLNSVGLSATATFGGQTTVDGKAVIAQGERADLVASARTAPSSATIALQNSDFDIALETPEEGGVATVPLAGSGTNIVAPPMLANDGFHQLPNSPTIDKGATDAFSGTTDIDTQARSIGTGPDIGADEAARPTKTTLACTPGAVVVGGSTTCTVSVEDTSPTEAAAPTGGLAVFAANHRGGFTPTPSCQLQSSDARTATCQVTFSPSEAASYTVFAGFRGDQSHDSSTTTAPLSVFAPHPTKAALTCAAAATGIICTATVTDGAVDPASPSGRVELGTDKRGTFGASVCTLAAAGPDRASCTVTYAPGEGGIHRLVATYKGDPTHLPSAGAIRIDLGGTSGPPNTLLRKAPRKKTKAHQALFVFLADQPRARFQCKLDKGRFKSCRSPFKKKVKAGRHTFQVRAIGATGKADPTPAVFRWKVVS